MKVDKTGTKVRREFRHRHTVDAENVGGRDEGIGVRIRSMFVLTTGKLILQIWKVFL